MKRDQEHELDQKLDRQLDGLARQLRDKGVRPERDLWPDIDRAIDRAEVIDGTARSRRSNPLAGWRIVALAASVLLLLGVGLVQMGGLRNGLPDGSNDYRAEITGPTPADSPEFAAAGLAGSEDDAAAGKQIIDQALRDLNQALADDPNNARLSRLILMIHTSRGNLIRNTTRRLVSPGL